MAITAASLELRQYLWKSEMQAAKTRPIEAAFIPTSVHRTHACLRAASQYAVCTGERLDPWRHGW